MRETKYRTCNVCEAMCGMVITVEDGRITDVRGDEDDVLSRGHICPKGPAMRELQEDPDRLRQPVRRTTRGGRVSWEKIGWEEALDEVARRLRDVQARHGENAVGAYIGNPTVHNHGAVLMGHGFLKTLGTKNRFDANSQDANPRLYSSLFMHGDATALTIPDIDRTDYMLMLGANPAASGGSLMSLGDVRGRLKAIRERGARLVLIDPRRTETAAFASEHRFIRPGGDAAFLLAFLHVLFADKLIDEGAVGQTTLGLGELRAVTKGFAPADVAAVVGIDAATIARLAREFAGAKSAVAYGRVGVCQNEFGAVASWLIDAINAVTGNFDRAGGAMFPSPAADLSFLARKLGVSAQGRWHSRVRGLPELGSMLPASVMAEEMETPGPGQIRAMVTIAGNPVLSVPNGERISRALAGLEFMVSIDLYANETTRHATIILPPRYALERSHFDIVFHAIAVRNTVKYSEPVVAPGPDTKEDFEILYELGMRMGGIRFGNGVLDRAVHMAWRAGQKLTADFIIDVAVRLGPYGDKFNPFSKGLNLARIKQAPHGIDLGPLVPGGRSKRLRTPGHKVMVAPRPLVADVPRVARWVAAQRAATAGGELVLIGRRHMRTNNSWMHNCHSLTKGPDRATLLMHPNDAARLRLVDGGLVQITSRVGAITTRLELSDTVMPGVVSLPHGYGHADVADTMKNAGALAGPNMNAITDEAYLEPLTGTAVLNGVPVTVQAVAALAVATG